LVIFSLSGFSQNLYILKENSKVLFFSAKSMRKFSGIHYFFDYFDFLVKILKLNNLMFQLTEKSKQKDAEAGNNLNKKIDEVS